MPPRRGAGAGSTGGLRHLTPRGTQPRPFPCPAHGAPDSGSGGGVPPGAQPGSEPERWRVCTRPHGRQRSCPRSYWTEGWVLKTDPECPPLPLSEKRTETEVRRPGRPQGGRQHRRPQEGTAPGGAGRRVFTLRHRVGPRGVRGRHRRPARLPPGGPGEPPGLALCTGVGWGTPRLVRTGGLVLAEWRPAAPQASSLCGGAVRNGPSSPQEGPGAKGSGLERPT